MERYCKKCNDWGDWEHEDLCPNCIEPEVSEATGFDNAAHPRDAQGVFTKVEPSE